MIAMLVCSLAVFCCHNASKTYGVFDYEDFGPQSMAWEKIGMQWWQWDSQGISSNPIYEYDIKVVVYREMPLAQLKALYPVEKVKKKDFRYFAYDDAIN